MKRPPFAAQETLKRFGFTLDNRQIWRLIWSDEKITWGDGKQVQEYAHLPGRWILEKWIKNAVGPEEWERTKDPETGEYILGPYENGSYELAYAFPIGVEMTSAIVELIPRLINAGLERFTFSERRNAIAARLAKKKEDWRKRNSDIWDDAQPAFGMAAVSGYGGHRVRSPEDIPLLYTADDLPREFARLRGFSQA